ncbi:uncharacterized protein LY79DRAFT_562359 [Colletotrichum navitas]|uniref:Uncharacterized protein n=1 Tax=Colletotrichum navitas TaxID=681940 RepID=A0AAD8PTV8_9PEZI|nr:uncharacterized protein LY79DRAFT_562359 [Colletotrichum navitas]KAK1580122.1 hypothetical protein LY79DRAFT_562359 [Colletotrichum navitas]
MKLTSRGGNELSRHHPTRAEPPVSRTVHPSPRPPHIANPSRALVSLSHTRTNQSPLRLLTNKKKEETLKKRRSRHFQLE